MFPVEYKLRDSGDLYDKGGGGAWKLEDFKASFILD
jgi:hypothetical protein